MCCLFATEKEQNCRYCKRDQSSIWINIIGILLCCKSDRCFGLEMILWVMPSELLSWKERRKFKYCTQPFLSFRPHRDRNRPRCLVFRCRPNFPNTCRKSAPLTCKQNTHNIYINQYDKPGCLWSPMLFVTLPLFSGSSWSNSVFIFWAPSLNLSFSHVSMAIDVWRSSSASESALAGAAVKRKAWQELMNILIM